MTLTQLDSDKLFYSLDYAQPCSRHTVSELSLMSQGWGWGRLQIQMFTVIQAPQTLYCVRPCFSAFMVTQEQV